MRVIVWGINYAPEVTGIAPYNVALCEALRERGHAAEMLTTFAYYPTWKKRPEDKWQIYRTDLINDVQVHRCWHFVPARLAAWKRILHEASFVGTSSLRGLSLPRADVYVVVSPPLLLAAAAWLVTQWKSAAYVFHVQDLQPDAAVGLGMIESGWSTKALYALEKFAYEKAARVSGISRGMVRAFRAKGVPEGKLIQFPNGVRLPEAAPIRPRGSFRAAHNIASDEFLAVYSGNLGVKQGLDILIDAASILRGVPVRFVICGDGAQRSALAQRVAEGGLTNVLMLPLQPAAEYEAMLIDADVCLITQQAGAGSTFFPSKLLSTLALSKPVITVADSDSDLAHAVAEGRFGVNVQPGRPQELANVLQTLGVEPEPLAALGEAGRRFVQQFDSKTLLSSYIAELESLA
jgi:putative colanic acid biosynthesis glycosyltransferase WcaI